MALNKTQLRTDLEALFTAPTESYADAAEAWADAYAVYAANAKSCSTPGAPASLAAAKATLKAVLTTSFSTRTVASDTAGDMAAAFTAFWLVPPVPFSGTTPGVVTAVAGTAALQAALISTWAANLASQVSAAAAAESMAELLDIFTKTVLVTHVAPSACATTIV